MKSELSVNELLKKNQDLESRLEQAEQLIDAIKSGEVDAFALTRDNRSEIFTLQSGDYAYRTLVENFQEGALNLSEDGMIVYTNNYFVGLMGTSYDKVIGRPIADFIHPQSVNTFDELFKKGLAGQIKGEITLRAAKKDVHVYVSLTSLFPTLPSIGLIVTDLTEKQKHETVLEQKNNELARSNAELQKLNKELQSFAYISSHDLQEPLRKIQTFATRIVEQEREKLSAAGREQFQRMQAAAKRMQTLIDDLLAYTRTNMSGDNFKKTDLKRILEEVKEDLKDDLKEKHATIDSTELCDASVIPFQFRQLMHNLIGNSLKFSSPEKPPHIKIRSEIADGTKLLNPELEPKHTYCHITVSDNGIGFEPQYSEKIFEVFQRLHPKSAYNGTGIGLAIVKKIVENHHGVVTATSAPSKGATFDIYIPVVAEVTPA